ncbi:MAG: 4-hydroxy-3-methylbut-2-enyl diphosphate reductase, partial [Clostridia bacterium]|nr:4-hydroxy-3-methylbut-2-enyl diphosphate reductase [Clostridia bacterium]
MSIILAKSAGFCFGVKRAVDTLEKEAAESPISTLGPIIHNDDVVARLKSMGVESVEDMSQLADGSRLAIRTHGVGADVVEKIEQNGIEYMDLTCPFVKKIHKIVSEKHNEGYKIVIVGDKKHPEVIGINGWCGNSAVIVTDEAELEGKIAPDDRVCVVSQTTMDRKTFEKIIFFLKNTCQNPLVFDTICSATNERQKEAAHIAAQVDMMIVIGGRHSSNT